MTAGHRPPVKLARLAGLAAVVGITAGCAGGLLDGATVVSAPPAADRDATVAELDRAAGVQGICFGWRLSDIDARIVSRGSNLGGSIAVDSDPARCPRWLELRVQVAWTPETSESEDWAAREIAGSPDLAHALSEQALDAAGITEAALIDDPDGAVLRGAVALPLLVAERGLAGQVPAPTPTGTPDPDGLAAASSDLWRDRGGMLGAGVGLIVVAAGVLGLGWWATRQGRIVERRRAEQARQGKDQ